MGMTRTGKTTLSRRILAKESRLFVIDPKWCFKPLDNWSESGAFRRADYEITYESEKVVRYLQHSHVIFRPPVGFSQDDYDRLLQKTWNSRIEHTLSVDEVAMVCKSAMSSPMYLRAYYQQGGELGLKAMAISQRPSCIPLYLFSESEQHWLFRMLLKRDRERAGEWIGDEALLGNTTKHSFWYRSVHDDTPAKQFELSV